MCVCFGNNVWLFFFVLFFLLSVCIIRVVGCHRLCFLLHCEVKCDMLKCIDCQLDLNLVLCYGQGKSEIGFVYLIVYKLTLILIFVSDITALLYCVRLWVQNYHHHYHYHYYYIHLIGLNQTILSSGTFHKRYCWCFQSLKRKSRHSNKVVSITTTYCIELWTCTSVLRHGMKSLMWKLASLGAVWSNNCA